MNAADSEGVSSFFNSTSAYKRPFSALNVFWSRLFSYSKT